MIDTNLQTINSERITVVSQYCPYIKDALLHLVVRNYSIQNFLRSLIPHTDLHLIPFAVKNQDRGKKSGKGII